MNGTRSIKAEARLEGKWWFIYFPDLRLTGQAGRRDNLAQTAQTMAALFLDVPEADVQVSIDIAIPSSIRIEWDNSRELAASAALQEHQAAVGARRAVRDLLATGYTQRDAAMALGVSHQRIHQLSRPESAESGPAVAEVAQHAT